MLPLPSDFFFSSFFVRNFFPTCTALLALAAQAGAAEQYFNDSIFVQNYIRAGSNQNSAAGYSIAVGYNADAWGGHCAAFGFDSSAVGHSTLSAGWGTTANGQGSCSLGYYSTAGSFAELAIGRFNTLPSASTTSWEPGDRLLVLGMGSSTSARADALVILKNGNLTGNGTDNRLPLQTTLPDNASILTRTLGDARYFQNFNGQILLGSHHVGDANASLIVGNGVPGTPATSFKILKNGGIVAQGAATIAGTLGVTGNTTITGLSAGATTLTTLGVSGVAGFSSSVSISGSTSVTTLAASGDITGSGTNNTLPNQTTAPSDNSILTRIAADGRYFNNNDPQIVVGSFEVPDPNAAIVVGNGTGANSRSNSFVVKKDGSVIVTGSQSDLSMGNFN